MAKSGAEFPEGQDALFESADKLQETVFEPHNDVNNRAKHLTKAALKLLRANGKITVRIFPTFEPENLQEVSIEQRMVHARADNLQDEGRAVRQKILNDAKKDFFTAALIDELPKSHLVSHAAAKRIGQEILWKKFQLRITSEFGQCYDLEEVKEKLIAKFYQP